MKHFILEAFLTWNCMSGKISQIKALIKHWLATMLVISPVWKATLCLVKERTPSADSIKCMIFRSSSALYCSGQKPCMLIWPVRIMTVRRNSADFNFYHHHHNQQ